MAFIKKDALDRACEQLEIKVEQVVSYRVDDDVITLVVDRGIAGSPKYILPLIDLFKPAPPPLPKTRTTKSAK